MVKIRLRRAGKKKQPVYKIVVADSRAWRNGKFIEAIGQYNPLVNPMVINVKEDRLFGWLKRGAQPTDTTRSLLQRKGLWLKWGLMKKGADEATIAAEFEKWQLLQPEKSRREAERKARRKATRKKNAAAEAPAIAGTAPASTAEPAVEPAAAPTVS
ncbi:MAG: 30S ribosomal protein S16 [Ignavibacteriae bacterium]|nr:30S ribosomal protein S16 [Ignavibacteria bacterium]MBI3365386.1 30S ribosomal protein S16 [Ignavibacteriota bacterium]